MISLKQPSEPFDIELPYGVTVTVKPLTTAGMAAAQASARRRVEVSAFSSSGRDHAAGISRAVGPRGDASALRRDAGGRGAAAG